MGDHVGLQADSETQEPRTRKRQRSTNGRANRTISRYLRFSTDNSGGSDPGEETEAVGDADAIKSTGLGLLNLKRTVKLLVPATTNEKGANYDDLSEIYGRLFGQWTLEMNHVGNIVGGFNSQEKHIGQPGARFTPVPRAHQADAVKFLNENAFQTPTWAIDKDILRKIEPIGVLNRVRNAQNSVLNNLLSSSRFARLAEQSAIDGAASYQPGDFLADVRSGVWGELGAPRSVSMRIVATCSVRIWISRIIS